MDQYFQNVLIEFTERWRRVGKKKGKAKDEEELDMKEKYWVKGRNKEMMDRCFAIYDQPQREMEDRREKEGGKRRGKEKVEAAGYRVHRYRVVFEVSIKYAPIFYLDTAYRPVIRRPWKIEFGCTVVFNQIIASCLVSLEYMRAHARAHACACLFRDLSLLRRASFFSHSLLHTLACSFASSFSLFLSRSFALSLSLSQISFFFSLII